MKRKQLNCAGLQNTIYFRIFTKIPRIRSNKDSTKTGPRSQANRIRDITGIIIFPIINNDATDRAVHKDILTGTFFLITLHATNKNPMLKKIAIG
ncbi:hypothetical protein EXS57_00975 [Candidatus Kaiserbacteria bacterium]|nr:hypothetical protein [Candidatus Kaiserbacteria bacterium]